MSPSSSQASSWETTVDPDTSPQRLQNLRARLRFETDIDVSSRGSKVSTIGMLSLIHEKASSRNW
jgi:hypothetical protein